MFRNHESQVRGENILRGGLRVIEAEHLAISDGNGEFPVGLIGDDDREDLKTVTVTFETNSQEIVLVNGATHEGPGLLQSVCLCQAFVELIEAGLFRNPTAQVVGGKELPEQGEFAVAEFPNGYQE